VKPTLSMAQLQYLHQINQYIENEISRSNFIVDMMLASARAGTLARNDFANHSIKKCVDEALASYPFETAMREKSGARVGRFHLLRLGRAAGVRAVQPVQERPACDQIGWTGEVEIRLAGRQLMITDTGSGIPDDVLHVFERFTAPAVQEWDWRFAEK
jgi:hypothetical protein